MQSIIASSTSIDVSTKKSSLLPRVLFEVINDGDDDDDDDEEEADILCVRLSSSLLI